MKRPANQSSLNRKVLSAIRHGSPYLRQHFLLQRSQWWSRERLAAYQHKRLSKLLTHAYEHVPYYTRIFDERGLTPNDVKTPEDLKKLPYLTREIVRDHVEELKATNYPASKLESVTTGGSTGIPLRVYYEKGVSNATEWAFMRTLWGRVGYRFSDKCAVFRSNIVASADRDTFWETSLFGRWLVFSSYHMTDTTFPRYIEEIRKFKPKFIYGYPSTIAALARFMSDYKIEHFPTVEALLCGSENLYQWQRNLLEETFHCRAFSWYGHTEQAVLAGECEMDQRYHLFPEYGLTELIDKDGGTVTSEGACGEIVVTGLKNFVMPLIRYRTKDLAYLSTKPCSCGRNYPLLTHIEGRAQEFVKDRNNHNLSLTALLAAIHDSELAKATELQIVQERPGELTIRARKSRSEPESMTKDAMQTLFEKRAQGLLSVNVEIVDHIPRNPRGKFIPFIQKINVESQRQESSSFDN